MRGNNFATDERTVEPTTQIVVDMRYMGGFLARMRVR